MMQLRLKRVGTSALLVAAMARRSRRGRRSRWPAGPAAPRRSPCAADLLGDAEFFARPVSLEELGTRREGVEPRGVAHRPISAHFTAPAVRPLTM